MAIDAKPLEQTLRVLICDDNEEFRAGVQRALEERGIAVAGQAASGEEAIALAPNLEPDVVLMDLRMPGIGGLEATKRIAALAPSSRVVVLTVSDADEDVIDAVLAGASGYLVKDSSLEELVHGIELASAGKAPISPSVATKVLDRVRATTPDAELAARIGSTLSRRELQVLELLAAGKDNVEIGRELVISPKTVKNHISSILAKLDVENRVQAALQAVRAGLA